MGDPAPEAQLLKANSCAMELCLPLAWHSCSPLVNGVFSLPPVAVPRIPWQPVVHTGLLQQCFVCCWSLCVSFVALCLIGFLQFAFACLCCTARMLNCMWKCSCWAAAVGRRVGCCFLSLLSHTAPRQCSAGRGGGRGALDPDWLPLLAVKCPF